MIKEFAAIKESTHGVVNQGGPLPPAETAESAGSVETAGSAGSGPVAGGSSGGYAGGSSWPFAGVEVTRLP